MKKLLFFFLLFFSAAAFADYPATIKYSWGGSGSYFDTPSDVCANANSVYPQYVPIYGAFTYTTSPNRCTNSHSPFSDITISTVYRCNGAVHTSAICPGTNPNPPPQTCTKGDSSHNSQHYVTQGTPAPSSVCIDGCSFDYDIAVCTTLQCGMNITSGTGASCTVTSTHNAPNAENDCLKQGKTFITINNTTTCVPIGTSGGAPVTTKPTTTTNNTTNTTNSTTTTTNNTITTTTTTFNGDGSVTTTATTQTKDPTTGAVTGSTTSTTTKPQADFCKDNPTDKICKKNGSGTFGGSCGAFTCESDDGVQCAMAKEQHQRNCQLFQQNSTLDNLAATGSTYADGTANIGGLDPFKNPTTIDIGTIDQTSTIGKSLLTDQHFMIAGHDINLPASQLNNGLEIAGKIVLAFAFMMAARILFS